MSAPRISVRLEGGRYDGAAADLGLPGDDPVPPHVVVYACAIDTRSPCPFVTDARRKLKPGPPSRQLLDRLTRECHDGTGGHWFWSSLDQVTDAVPTIYRWDRQRADVQVYVLDADARTDLPAHGASVDLPASLGPVTP